MRLSWCPSSFASLPRQLGLALGLALAALPAQANAILELAPLFTRVAHTEILPVQIMNGAMVVEAKINGQGPFRLIVDSGCSASVISPAVAAAVEAHIPEQDAYMPAVNSLGTTTAFQYAVLDSIELGGARFEGVTAGITSLDLQSKIVGQRIDGLLGYSVFSELFLTLDFPRNRIIISSDFPAGVPAVRSELAIQEANAVPFVTINLQGHDYLMMVDSGANGSLELNSDDLAGLAWKYEPRVSGLVGAIGGTGRDWIGRLQGDAQLGLFTQHEPIIGIGSGVARIGTGFLRTLTVVFNRSQDRIWLCADSADPIPSPAKLSVGLCLLAESSGWQVAGTIPDSPAVSASIEPGDVISEIEGSSARTWTRDEIQQWIDQHPSLSLTIANATGSRHLDLPVWALVP